MFLFLLATGCATPPVRGPVKTIHVVRHGWHTGIAVARSDLTRVPAEFPCGDYLEFGWGDAEYYPTQHPTLSMGAKALFWPNPSVMHVAGVRGSLTNSLPHDEIVTLPVSTAGFARLETFIGNSFRQPCDSIGPGLYGDGRFYRANGKFFFAKTCNSWTASALRAAGYRTVPWLTFTSGQVLWPVRKD